MNTKNPSKQIKNSRRIQKKIHVNTHLMILFFSKMTANSKSSPEYTTKKNLLLNLSIFPTKNFSNKNPQKNPSPAHQNGCFINHNHLNPCIIDGTHLRDNGNRERSIVHVSSKWAICVRLCRFSFWFNVFRLHCSANCKQFGKLGKFGKFGNFEQKKKGNFLG